MGHSESTSYTALTTKLEPLPAAATTASLTREGRKGRIRQEGVEMRKREGVTGGEENWERKWK